MSFTPETRTNFLGGPLTSHSGTRSQQILCVWLPQKKKKKKEGGWKGWQDTGKRCSLKLCSRSASSNGQVLSAFSGGKRTRAIEDEGTHCMESNQKIMALLAKNCFRRQKAGWVWLCVCAPVYWCVNAQKCASSLFIILCHSAVVAITFKRGQATNIYGQQMPAFMLTEKCATSPKKNQALHANGDPRVSSALVWVHSNWQKVCQKVETSFFVEFKGISCVPIL